MKGAAIVTSIDITNLERANVSGVELEYEVRGTGEPVVLIHGGIVADAFAPIATEEMLAARYRVVRYHRRGFAGSTHPVGPVSIAEQAADCRALLRCLGIERAHAVGHSLGGAIALQLALDAPEAVHSLALLESDAPGAPSEEQFFEQFTPVIAMYESGNIVGAIENSCRLVAGPRFRDGFAHLPAGAFDQAVADAATLFQVDLPALESWTFNSEMARRITVPVLAVLGADSRSVAPVFSEAHELLRAWLPQAEPFILPGATHALQMMNPQGMTEGLTAFFRRHPMTRASS
jgi:pimeloyl-ACP methyl ester carboxylesterase